MHPGTGSSCNNDTRMKLIGRYEQAESPSGHLKQWTRALWPQADFYCSSIGSTQEVFTADLCSLPEARLRFEFPSRPTIFVHWVASTEKKDSRDTENVWDIPKGVCFSWRQAA
ncbi:hypothetical protein GJ744_004101 [Endocarpon pusillum]|uniref:Uncharacterized protein n=1 Tax=Endocarpon pusillum TaxID=364733 RepID=A0A8H7E7X2_9EURO|nr:hypothetical protein GJ744_004101 [Endocarpon pusillum]